MLFCIVIDECTDSDDISIRHRSLAALNVPTSPLAPRYSAILPVPLLYGGQLVLADPENNIVLSFMTFQNTQNITVGETIFHPVHTIPQSVPSIIPTRKPQRYGI